MVARLVWDQKVGGSNPSTPTIFNYFCNNMQDFSSIIPQIISAKTVEDMISHLKRFFHLFGIIKYNYTTLEQAMMHHNYDQSWCERYRTRNYSKIDPAIIVIKMYNHYFTWEEACNEMKNIHITPDQKATLMQMQNSVKMEGLEHGICIPMFAYPFGQNGFYLSLKSDEKLQDSTFMSQLIAMCSIFNNAFAEINTIQKETKHTKFPFSQRECEVIRLIYNGKERSDIAEMMDISINTVDTLTKRIFGKVRVNTKVQLVTKILTSGWSHVFVSQKS